ncbi:hypothetical protein M0Q97_11515 [Candidatus Dojkabacteria bacterium]|jgi:hypothetical protein|nr:hypothetical protein [Candidatus Dojkabacteria bacterium]
MNELEKEIQEAIAKNLPSQVGEVLTKKLEELENVKRQNSSFQLKLKSKEEEIEAYLETIEKLRRFDDMEQTLIKKEKELQDRERAQKIFELETQLKCEIEKTTFGNSILNSLVRNIEYRKNVFNNETINIPPYTDKNGNYQCMGVKTKITQEETKETQE